MRYMQKLRFPPGWRTVQEEKKAIFFGLADRMMIEISSERDFVVIAPAFYGYERVVALQEYSH